LQRGTPYIYQGEEFGMTNMPFRDFDDFQDIEARNYYRDARDDEDFDAGTLLAAMSRQSRDNARTPVQWDSSEHAGFTTGMPWFRVNPNYPEVNAEAAVADEESVYHHYRKLIELRHNHPVVVNGDFQMLLQDDPAVYAFTRSLGDTTMLVLGNFSSDNVPASLPDAEEWAAETLLLGNYPAPEGSEVGITLRPWETRVYLRD
jgi:oligo-1,6-glucosidase